VDETEDRVNQGGLPGETEKFRALGHLSFTPQLLVKALNKRTIDESLEKMPSATLKRRQMSLILPSQ
jgi:hypothetical protein